MVFAKKKLDNLSKSSSKTDETYYFQDGNQRDTSKNLTKMKTSPIQIKK